jgi:hypothetical protein
MFNWHTVGDCQVSECDQPWFTDDGLKQMFNWHTGKPRLITFWYLTVTNRVSIEHVFQAIVGKPRLITFWYLTVTNRVSIEHLFQAIVGKPRLITFWYKYQNVINLGLPTMAWTKKQEFGMVCIRLQLSTKLKLNYFSYTNLVENNFKGITIESMTVNELKGMHVWHLFRSRMC